MLKDVKKKQKRTIFCNFAPLFFNFDFSFSFFFVPLHENMMKLKAKGLIAK